MKEIELFKRWLVDNTDTFHYKPRIIQEEPNNLELQFEGLTEKLVCIVSQYSIDIWYLYDNDKIDLLYAIDMPSDENLIVNKPAFISRLTESSAMEAFKYLLSWINSIKPGDQVRIMDCLKNGFFCVELKHQKKHWTYKEIKPIYLPLTKK